MPAPGASSFGAPSQMKVVLKLSGSKHKAAKHTGEFPSFTAAAAAAAAVEELVVSIPLALLRPATPTAVEEEEPVMLHSHEYKHHKTKKHKKHKKHSSHEMHPPQGAEYDKGHTSQTPNLIPIPQGTPEHTVNASLSGKHLSFAQSHGSPFKFTISKTASEESVLHRSSFSSTSPAIDAGSEESKGHIHKHKKRHHYHPPPQLSPHVPAAQTVGISPSLQRLAGVSPSSRAGVSVGAVGMSPAVVGGVRRGGMEGSGGKHHVSPEEALGTLSEDTSRSIVMESQDSLDTSSSFHDSPEILDQDVADLGTWSRDLGSHIHGSGGSGKSHKKKDKKKKHKRSHLAPPPPQSLPSVPMTSVEPPLVTQPTTPNPPMPFNEEMTRKTGLKRRRHSGSDDELPPVKRFQSVQSLTTKSSTVAVSKAPVTASEKPTIPTINVSPRSNTPPKLIPPPTSTAPIQGKAGVLSVRYSFSCSDCNIISLQ